MQVNSKNWEVLGDRFCTASSWKWWERGDRKRAEYYYKQAVKVQPSNSRLWYKLSLCTAFPESLDCIENAIQLDPTNFEFIYRKAYLLAFCSRNGEEAGLQIAMELVRIYPDNAKGLVLLSEIAQEKAGASNWNLLVDIDELMLVAENFSSANLFL